VSRLTGNAPLFTPTGDSPRMESILPSGTPMSKESLRVVCLAALTLSACGSAEIPAWLSVDGSTPDGAQAGAGGNAAAAGADSDGSDSSTEDSDARTDSDGGAGGTSNDAGPDGAAGSGALDGGVDGCPHPIVYYRDSDRDGHGSPGTAVLACSPPANGDWSLTATDCNDRNSRVHPDQDAYFDVPYRAASGADSFDYDCSGVEDEEPSQPKAPDNCGLLSLALCGGTGYVKTAREGQGLSPFCGSQQTNTCRAALGILLCESVTEPADEPFRCK
jgi:hypothetical protein